MMLNQALFLVQLGAWSVHLSDNVGHSCLEKVENDAWKAMVETWSQVSPCSS